MGIRQTALLNHLLDQRVKGLSWIDFGADRQCLRKHAHGLLKIAVAASIKWNANAEILLTTETIEQNAIQTVQQHEGRGFQLSR